MNPTKIIKRRIMLKVRYFAVKSRFLSAFYYIFASKSFAREQQSVLSGRIKYEDQIKNDRGNHYMLRRNVHRLEKGLTMRPRRNVFALSYIAETVDCYEKVISNEGICTSNEDELLWAHDVLKLFFDVTNSYQGLESTRKKFNQVEKPSHEDPMRVPYHSQERDAQSMAFEMFKHLAKQRRSVRWYLPREVARGLIDKAVSAAALSPSACNRQSYKFYIFDDPHQVQEIAALPMGTKGFRENIPVIVVLVAKLSAYFSDRDRHVIYIDTSLAAMTFMYALETLGLSSCPLNWADVEEREKRIVKKLSLAPDERVIMLISLGYPDPEGLIPYSQKKPFDQLREYNVL